MFKRHNSKQELLIAGFMVEINRGHVCVVLAMWVIATAGVMFVYAFGSDTVYYVIEELAAELVLLGFGVHYLVEEAE